MTRFILDLLWLTPSPDQHAGSDQDHRQREPLPHRKTERKKPKEIIGLPEIFDSESEHAVADQKRARDRAHGPRLGGVDPQDDEQQRAFQGGLVELRGMARE